MNFGGIQVQNAVQNREIKQSKQVFKLLCDSFKQPNTETHKKKPQNTAKPSSKKCICGHAKTSYRQTKPNNTHVTFHANLAQKVKT